MSKFLQKEKGVENQSQGRRDKVLEEEGDVEIQSTNEECGPRQVRGVASWVKAEFMGTDVDGMEYFLLGSLGSSLQMPSVSKENNTGDHWLRV